MILSNRLPRHLPQGLGEYYGFHPWLWLSVKSENYFSAVVVWLQLILAQNSLQEDLGAENGNSNSSSSEADCVLGLR